MRVLSIAYVVFLTVLLLVENPFRLLGLQGSPGWLVQAIAVTAHFVAFFGLTVLVLSTRWRVPRGMLVLLMAGYALGTELLQALVPARTPALADLLQDLVGIGLGGLIWWVGLGLLRRVIASAATVEGER